MSEPQIDKAVQRIEAALQRISDAVDIIVPAPPSVSGLLVRHENLQKTISDSLRQLDVLIERLEN